MWIRNYNMKEWEKKNKQNLSCRPGERYPICLCWDAQVGANPAPRGRNSTLALLRLFYKNIYEMCFGVVEQREIEIKFERALVREKVSDRDNVLLYSRLLISSDYNNSL